jgi:hypothetical protein
MFILNEADELEGNIAEMTAVNRSHSVHSQSLLDRIGMGGFGEPGDCRR